MRSIDGILRASMLCAGWVIPALAAIHFPQGDVHSAEAPSTQNVAQPGMPVNVIFDTDVWNDIDDALALAMLHALQDRGELKLVAVTISTDEPWCAAYIDLINTFYDHAQIPLGIVRDGMNRTALQKKFPETKWPTNRYMQSIVERRTKDGTPMYPRRSIERAEVPEAVSLLRRTLAAQPDGSVVIIQVGYSTNLARLLDSEADAASALGGRDLIRKKVRLLSVMAGNFGVTTIDGKAMPKGAPEFNLGVDVRAAQKVFAEWPTSVVVSGFEIGWAMRYPPLSTERDYSYVENHPIADTYRLFCQERKKPDCPHAHPTFDLTSVLYAARPDRNYFSLSKPSRVIVLADGSTRFEESTDGMHRYLILDEKQKARTLEAMVMLVSQPPARVAIARPTGG